MIQVYNIRVALTTIHPKCIIMVEGEGGGGGTWATH